MAKVLKAHEVEVKQLLGWGLGGIRREELMRECGITDEIKYKILKGNIQPSQQVIEYCNKRYENLDRLSKPTWFINTDGKLSVNDKQFRMIIGADTIPKELGFGEGRRIQKGHIEPHMNASTGEINIGSGRPDNFMPQVDSINQQQSNSIATQAQIDADYKIISKAAKLNDPKHYRDTQIHKGLTKGKWESELTNDGKYKSLFASDPESAQQQQEAFDAKRPNHKVTARDDFMTRNRVEHARAEAERKARIAERKERAERAEQAKKAEQSGLNTTKPDFNYTVATIKITTTATAVNLGAQLSARMAEVIKDFADKHDCENVKAIAEAGINSLNELSAQANVVTIVGTTVGIITSFIPAIAPLAFAATAITAVCASINSVARIYRETRNMMIDRGELALEFKTLLKVARPIIEEMGKVIAKSLIDMIKAPIEAIANTFVNLYDNIRRNMRNDILPVAIVKGCAATIMNLVNGIVQQAKQVYATIETAVKTVVETAKTVVKTVVRTICYAICDVIDWVSSWFTGDTIRTTTTTIKTVTQQPVQEPKIKVPVGLSVAEAHVYKHKLNSAQRQIVDNFFSLEISKTQKYTQTDETIDRELYVLYRHAEDCGGPKAQRPQYQLNIERGTKPLEIDSSIDYAQMSESFDEYVQRIVDLTSVSIETQQEQAKPKVVWTNDDRDLKQKIRDRNVQFASMNKSSMQGLNLAY